jgi:hypothetical protein
VELEHQTEKAPEGEGSQLKAHSFDDFETALFRTKAALAAATGSMESNTTQSNLRSRNPYRYSADARFNPFKTSQPAPHLAPLNETPSYAQSQPPSPIAPRHSIFLTSSQKVIDVSWRLIDLLWALLNAHRKKGG